MSGALPETRPESRLSDEALAALIAKAQPDIRRQAMRALRDADAADDVTQDVLIKMWKYRGSFETIEHFCRWSYTVTANAIRDVCKTKARRRTISFRDYREAADTEADPEVRDERADIEARFCEAEAQASLKARISSLPKHFRDVLTLFAFEELSHREIGRRLGISADLSKMRLFRAKQALFATSEPRLYQTTKRRRGGQPGPRGMYARGGKLKRLVSALASGISIREAARVAGVSKVTAARAYRLLVKHRGKGRPILCACGRPSTHRGWCHVRFAKSPARQAVLARLHEQQRDGKRKRGRPRGPNFDADRTQYYRTRYAANRDERRDDQLARYRRNRDAYNAAKRAARAAEREEKAS